MSKNYYSYKAIDRKNADFNIVFGERSNGKTYGMFQKAVENFYKTGKQMAYIRRWQEDITGVRASRTCEGLNANDVVKRVTHGEWEYIHYNARKWYFARKGDADKPEICEQPFAFAFALSQMEHDKSTAFPNVNIIAFDEFITRGQYLVDEFVIFCNTISTIIRDRDDVKIYLMGNTVNKYNPYFAEMGLSRAKTQREGTIDEYIFNGNLKIAVEYCKSIGKSKSSNRLFKFPNRKLEMITDGKWELDIYPHLPRKYKPYEIAFTFYIEFDGATLQGDIVCGNDDTFIFIFPKTTPTKENSIVYKKDACANWYERTNITKPRDRIDKVIAGLFVRNKVFYLNNEIGEIVRNYIMWCNGLN